MRKHAVLLASVLIPCFCATARADFGPLRTVVVILKDLV